MGYEGAQPGPEVPPGFATTLVWGGEPGLRQHVSRRESVSLLACTNLRQAGYFQQTAGRGERLLVSVPH